MIGRPLSQLAVVILDEAQAPRLFDAVVKRICIADIW